MSSHFSASETQLTMTGLLLILKEDGDPHLLKITFIRAKGVLVTVTDGSANGLTGLVKECEASGCRLADLPRERLEAVLPGKGGAVAAVLGVPNALRAFQSYGSTAPAQVARQLAEWKDRVA